MTEENNAQQLNQSIEAKKEDAFYNFEVEEVNVMPLEESMIDNDQQMFMPSGNGNGGGTLSLYILSGGTPKIAYIKGRVTT